jgi:hypothetical protein
MSPTGVRIPANVDQPDKLIAGLTGRQLAILSITALVLYAAWSATRTVVPTLAFLVIAAPIGATAAILALGQRDGLSLDRLVLAAIQQRLQPRYRVAAPEGVRPAPAWLTNQISHANTGDHAGGHAVPEISPAPLRLPATGITDTGVVDLGTDGLALVAVCSTVNFALRTPAEQEALVAAFGRYLHSTAAPVQVLVRAERLDLSVQIARLRETAGGLPHPALEKAAREHADYLDQLRRTTDLLRRQVLLVLREPVQATGPADGLGGGSPLTGLLRVRRAAHHVDQLDDTVRRAAEARLHRRLAEAVELLGPAGIIVTPLETGQVTAVLAACCDPDSLIPPSAGLAGAEEVITGVVTTTGSAEPASGHGPWSDGVDGGPGSDDGTDAPRSVAGTPALWDTAALDRDGIDWATGPTTARLGRDVEGDIGTGINDAFERRDTP